MEPLWETGVPADDDGRRGMAGLPATARRLIAAVADGAAGGLFPPVVKDGPDGTVAVDRLLGGPEDARTLVSAFQDRRFAPLLALLDRLDSWCCAATRRYASVVADGVLDIVNADLFGPVVSEAFVACAAGRPHFARDRVAEWAERCEASLELFLERLLRDMSGHWPEDPRFKGPVVGLWAHGEETHNGRQRVIRLDCAGGGAVAYKPRPASGELLFTAEGTTGGGADAGRPASVFQLLNEAQAASGPVRLPVLACWPGAERGYLWQEWIEPPAQWGPIRSSGPWRLDGTRFSPPEAKRYWHRAGSLTAALFAFGVTDMIGSNVVTGSRPADPEPLLYPIDLEIYFCQVSRLYDTGLLHDRTADVDQHHVGLESTARWCAAEGPAVCWRSGPGGTLRLHRRRRPLFRQETRNVVADTQGRTGYGPYLPAMLRGMFDAWTLMCRQRPAIRDFLSEAAPGHHVRVLRQPTHRYFDALVPRWLSGGGAAPVPVDPDVRFDRPETEQLRRMDVPYFVRSLDGGPVLCVEPPPMPFTTAPVAARPEPEGGWPPVRGLMEGTNLELARLGVALRDAVEHVFDDVSGYDPDDYEVLDEASGVRLCLGSPGEGQVSFDWPEVGRRVTYLWDLDRIRLRIDPVGAPHPPSEPAPGGEIRRRLLRFDRLDGAIRTPWADGGMVDAVAERRLGTLTDAGIAWLSRVVAEHGWPGRRLVGSAAAAAASRLVQHTRGHLDFRRHCLDLMRQAATDKDLAWREVAYLTDEVRRDERLPQVYGTKFEPVAGHLVPYPIEDPQTVDERRAAMGLEPLAQYTERIRRRFPLAGRQAVQAEQAAQQIHAAEHAPKGREAP